MSMIVLIKIYYLLQNKEKNHYSLLIKILNKILFFYKISIIITYLRFMCSLHSCLTFGLVIFSILFSISIQINSCYFSFITYRTYHVLTPFDAALFYDANSSFQDNRYLVDSFLSTVGETSSILESSS